MENQELFVESSTDTQVQEGGFYRRGAEFLGSLFYVLDISNSETTMCKTLELEINGVPAKLFSVKLETRVTTVVDGGLLIWESENDDEECLSSIVYLKEGEPQMVDVIVKSSDSLLQEHYKYKSCFLSRFGLGGKAWSPSTKKYVDKINALRVSNAPIILLTLDISSDRDGENYNIIKDEKDDLTTRLYAPKRGYAIVTIVDGGETIWEAEGVTTCFFCEVFYKYSSIVLLIAVNDGRQNYSERFEKKDGVWKDLTHLDFVSKISGMNSRSNSIEYPPRMPLSAEYGIILDIANPNSDETDVYKRIDDDVVYEAFTPNDDAYIYTIVENGALIWSPDGDEKCECVATYSKGTRTILILDVVNGSDFCAKCFEKNDSLWNVGDGGWKEITLAKFSERIRAME